MNRLRVDVFTAGASNLARDVERGLLATQKSLPSKYLYDERGSVLFDQICDTEAYYPTRTEARLLSDSADDLMKRLRPTSLVELGSGAARKTRTLLEASARVGDSITYVPFDVSEEMLRESAIGLLEDFPWLRIHGVVGDYDLHLDRVPRHGTRLIAFLGGTIGNFSELEATRFLRKVAGAMGPDDRFLLGTDLVKDLETLNRAYNDPEGYTAAFNLNVLNVVNKELDAAFEQDDFEHRAFFREDLSRIEMHLRARRAHEVRVEGLGITVGFEEGETILTEISRKFTKASVEALLSSAGLRMESWYTTDDSAFGLSVARRA